MFIPGALRGIAPVLTSKLLQTPIVARNMTSETVNNIAKILPKVVFVLGGPGAGKGTQCEKIAQSFGYTHLSAGELLRAERNKSDSEVGVLIQKHITDGSIVPVKITCSLLAKAMADTMNKDISRDKFLVDGFPRNEDNLKGWMESMGEHSIVKFVLFFDCSEEVCISRCLDRGKAGSGRTDDNIESLKKRITTYNNSTKGIINHYEKLNMVKRIDADQDIYQVFEEVKKLFTEN